MAMRIEFGAPFFNHIWSRGFLSCSGRVAIYAPNIRCANKLAHCKYEKFVWSALPNCKPIAYSFCWRERKRKYVSPWKMARSKWKWTSIATVPDLCSTAVKILTHLISRYQLPLTIILYFLFFSYFLMPRFLGFILLLIFFLIPPWRLLRDYFLADFLYDKKDGSLLNSGFTFRFNSTEKKEGSLGEKPVCVLWVRYKDREKERRDGYSSVQTQGMLRPNLNTVSSFSKTFAGLFWRILIPSVDLTVFGSLSHVKSLSPTLPCLSISIVRSWVLLICTTTWSL
jgi:hypothetical protein